MTENLFFYFGLVFMVIHEMDAVRCREWRIFPGLNLLSDRLGFIIFIFAHIPIFLFVFIELNNLIIYLDIFFIGHLILHLIYLRNPKNEFVDLISWIFIAGPAIFGLIDLIILCSN